MIRIVMLRRRRAHVQVLECRLLKQLPLSVHTEAIRTNLVGSKVMFERVARNLRCRGDCWEL